MLAKGSDYIAPFGTTGEAQSLTFAERTRTLEHVIGSGVAKANQLMPGTGTCALREAADLTAHALNLGVAAVMVLPPFYYPNPGLDGLYRYFSELIESVR